MSIGRLLAEGRLQGEQLPREAGAGEGANKFFRMAGEIGHATVPLLAGAVREVIAVAAAELVAGRRQVQLGDAAVTGAEEPLLPGRVVGLGGFEERDVVEGEGTEGGAEGDDLRGDVDGSGGSLVVEAG